jgi:hypothetical protein
VDPINTSPRYLQDIPGGTSTPAKAGSLPNLSAIADNTDGASNGRQIEVATGQRIAREFTAYGYLAAQANATGDTTPYLKAYITFYDSLSPAEQQSPRYAGTREAAVNGLAANGASAPAASTVDAATSQSTTTSAPAATAASRSAQALSILAAQAQTTASSSTSNFTNLNNYNNNGTGGLPTADLLSSLRSLLGAIEDERHPAPYVGKPIPDLVLPKLDTTA